MSSKWGIFKKTFCQMCAETVLADYLATFTNKFTDFKEQRCEAAWRDIRNTLNSSISFLCRRAYFY